MTFLEAAGIVGMPVPDDPLRTAPPDDAYDIAAKRRALERDEANDDDWARDELFERAWEEVNHVPR